MDRGPQKPGQRVGVQRRGQGNVDRGPTSMVRPAPGFVVIKETRTSSNQTLGAIGLCSKMAVDDKQTPAPLNGARGGPIGSCRLQ